jgi:RNA polymerase sigma-70 factor, ECF subfamily
MAPQISGMSDFDEVLESCRRFLLAVAIEELPANLRAKGGASDLVQQTLAKAVRSEHQFRGQTVGELRAWLRAILASEAASFRRRYSGTAARDVGREVSFHTATARDDRTPVVVAIRAEQTEHLSTALAQLPVEQRETVALRMEDQLSFAEIGERLGRSEEAARKLFSRALDRLRGRLADDRDDC